MKIRLKLNHTKVVVLFALLAAFIMLNFQALAQSKGGFLGESQYKGKPRAAEKYVIKKKVNPKSASKRFVNPGLNKKITSGGNLNKKPRDGSKYVTKRKIKPRSKSKRFVNTGLNRRITSGINLNKNPRYAERYILKSQSPFGRSPSPEDGKQRKYPGVVQGYKSPEATFTGFSKRNPKPGKGEYSSFTGNDVVKGKPGKGAYSTFSGNMAVKKRPGPGEASQFQGFLPVKHRRPPKGPGSTFAGTIPVRKTGPSPGSNYTGSLVVGIPKPGPGQSFSGDRVYKQNRSLDKKRYAYRGDMKVRKDNRGVIALLSYYLQNYRLGFPKDPYNYKKAQRKTYAYRGEYKGIKPARDAHPSSRYRGALTNQTLFSQETVRKTSIWWSRLFKNEDQPQDVRKKLRSPRYDKNENDIWND